MPPRLPRRPPLAMKLWLAQRFGRAKPGEAPSEASGPTLSKAMGIDSLEHIVRNRVRMFLRNTWLVAILGTLLIGAGIYSAIYISIAPTEMRIAAGPAGSTDVKFVQLLAGRFASEHDKIRLHLVVTDGPKQSAEALADDKADLAILPSTTGDSLVWPVVAIVRQNVMALIVPTPPPTVPAKKEAAPPPKKEETAGADKGEKAGKGGKEAKDSKKGAVAAKTATKSAKGAKNEKSEKSEKNDKAGKGAKSTKVAKKGDADADKDDDADTSDDASGGKDGKDADTTSADADDANKLDKITKLAGHRVGIVTGSAATKDLLDAVLNHYGVPLAQVQVSYVDPKNAADAIKAKQVDVLFAVGPSTGHAINRCHCGRHAGRTRADFHRHRSGGRNQQTRFCFQIRRHRCRHLWRQSADPGRQPHESEFRRISGGPKRVQSRRHLRAGQTDLFVAARARGSDAARDQD